ncbi:pyruvate kinase [Alkalilimnicola ehrlichii]|uniref:Pyruvate kinase n=1 Tax=Alkalilimnicola ehrlichii TaxID=351052 RepID=A0A3E0X3T2_9GAMM|nr:pyruvate kinase [Alkalilimnicola ehrlichii]RFA31221.1 pyruvate kinase [Alkalilimnicola ehrlichii]RFA39500.1 pyruvate kinase [Alkalilimnicola ehrlichii]
MPRRTKIVATLGPVTTQPDVLAEMLRAGLDVVRLNLSHGDRVAHWQQLQLLREAAQREARCVGIMLDLQGPKIRIERFREKAVALKKGNRFILDAELATDAGDERRVGVSYKGLPGDVAPGDILLLDDGLLRLQVERVIGSEIHTEVLVGGRLANSKGINRLGGGLSVAALTAKDREDIRFAAEAGADYLAVSFPRNADDIHEARRLLREAGGHGGIVAKIERREALDHLDAIIDASDAVMIARGDLAVEIGDAELAGVQKDLLQKAQTKDCVVITATQMMQSMVHSPQPTRAEVLDVANAILDGTDAVMLSEETAAGEHPVAVVEAMARICQGTERYQRFHRGREQGRGYRYVDEAIAKASIDTANRLQVKAIAAFTESGSTALWMSRIGTEVPIYAFTRHDATQRRLSLYRGVYPRRFDITEADHSQVNREVVGQLESEGAVATGDLVIITKGDLAGVEGGTNTMKIVRVGAVP